MSVIQPTTSPTPTTSTDPQAVDFTNLDPQVVQLAKAIRTTESNNNYNAVGDNGESHGAYQFNKGNFQHWASQFGLNPNDMSPVNQDKVAYAKMKTWKDEGYHAGEIAAMWNGASMENGRPVANNPNYIVKVQKALSDEPASDVKPSTDPAVGAYQPNPTVNLSTPDPTTPTPQNPTLGQSVGAVAGGVANSVGNFLTGLAKGSEQRLASIGDPMVRGILGMLGDKNAAAQTTQAQQPFQTNGSASQGAGAFVGKDVLPAAGVVAAGGVGLGAAGVDVPGMTSGAVDTAQSVIDKIEASKTLGVLRKITLAKGIWDMATKGATPESILEIAQKFL